MFYSHVCTRVLTNPILCPAVIRPRQMMLRLLRRSQQDVASKSRRGQRKSMVSWCSRFFVLSVSMNFYPNFRYPTAIVLANLFLENMEWPQIIHIWWNFPWKKSSSCWGIPPFMETPTCPIRAFPLAKKIGFRSKPGASPLWQSEWSHNQKASGVAVHRRKHEKLGPVGSFVFQDGQFQIPVMCLFFGIRTHKIFHFNSTPQLYESMFLMISWNLAYLSLKTMNNFPCFLGASHRSSLIGPKLDPLRYTPHPRWVPFRGVVLSTQRKRLPWICRATREASRRWLGMHFCSWHPRVVPAKTVLCEVGGTPKTTYSILWPCKIKKWTA